MLRIYCSLKNLLLVPLCYTIQNHGEEKVFDTCIPSSQIPQESVEIHEIAMVAVGSKSPLYEIAFSSSVINTHYYLHSTA